MKTKTLIFDIETSPNLGYVWGKYEQNVIEYTKEFYILGFAYKWLGQKKTHTAMLPDFGGYSKDPTNDEALCRHLWELFDQADIVVAHHGDRFDIPKSNARFLAHGFSPPSPYKTVDTKKVASKYFKLNSNKLDDIGQYLGVGRKMKHNGFETWTGCMSGDPKAWKMMRNYNRQDVILLEQIYLKLRPWMTNHPNTNIYNGTTMNCPQCTSANLHKKGFNVTKIGKRQAYHCQSCGGWSQGELIPTDVIIR